MIVRRQKYIDAMRAFRDVPLVKILAGIRRCGKSTILEMLREDLLADGIAPDHIIRMQYTAEVRLYGRDCVEMYESIRCRMTGSGRYYLLLDEVQEVDDWEKAVNSLLENSDTDIYVTGSNSRLLAGEISTCLTGRYILIPVFPLSFAEYLDFRKDDSRHPDQILGDYIRYGGFPIVAQGNFTQRSAYQIVSGIYTAVVKGDILRRNHVANMELFDRIVLFIMDNMGKTFSARAIASFLKSEKRQLSVETVYNYLAWLEKAFVIYRCRRFDLQGKAILKTQEKFYLADPSLKYCVMDYDPKFVSAAIENIVYLELKRRGYDVYMGKNEAREIDFVAVLRGERVYVQVCEMLPRDSDLETANLLEIRDHYPKYVVSLDPLAGGNVNGVRIMHLRDFLLREEL